SLDKHHWEGRPSRPHLQRVAPPPPVEVAPVFQILVRDACGIEHLPRSLRMGILGHADNNHVVSSNGGLHLESDGGVSGLDLLPDGGVDMGFVEDVASHY